MKVPYRRFLFLYNNKKMKTSEKIFKIIAILAFSLVAGFLYFGNVMLCGVSSGTDALCIIIIYGCFVVGAVIVIFGLGIVVQTLKGRDYFISKRLTQIYFVVVGVLFVCAVVFLIYFAINVLSYTPSVPLLI